MAPVGNGMQFNRAQSFAPPKKVADVPMFKRAQSFTAALDITMSVDSLYNHAIRYLKKENNEELAEAAFKAALSRDPHHVSSLVGLGTLLKKIGREEEGTEMLHKATGLIMCPRSLPGEDQIRKQAAARSAQQAPPPSQLSARRLSNENEAPPAAPPKAPVRMGSMKAVLALSALNGGLADVTNARR